MSRPPVLDDRSQDELLADLTERADRYVDGWDGESADTASVLLAVFSQFGGDLIQRLNSLPRKHRAAFLETLGVQHRPPQAARLPLSVAVSADLDRNVAVPGGTRAVATTAADETEPFEIPQGEGFEVTPASLTEIRAVDPTADRLVSHSGLADGESETLFTGENRQQHALYLGDESLLTLEADSVIQITFEGSVVADALEDAVVWEYYGLDDATEGWHELPVAGTAAAAEDGTGESLDSRLERLSTPPVEPTDGEGYSVRRRLPDELVPTTVGGVESRWVRCRLVEPPAACFATEIDSVRVRVEQPTDTAQTTPDAGFANDVPLSLDDDADIRPFGRLPQPSSTVYLAAEDALTKPGALVTLTFQPSTQADEEPSTDEGTSESPAPETTVAPSEADFGALGGSPEVSWEYWNGIGWAGLEIASDSTDGLTTAGDLQFVVPDDATETAVSGQAARWIRGRLVSGSYGEPAVGVNSDDDSGVDGADAPQFGGISLGYDHTHGSFAHAVARNNGVTEQLSATDRYRPFRRLPEDSQTVYFGFDDVLRNGPIPLFVPLAADYPQGFDPGVQWEYCTDPETDSWSVLPVDDGTGGLTERGVVMLRFSEPTTAHERFGRRCHWIRAVVTGDEFTLDVDEAPDERGSDTDKPDAATDTRPPVVSGIYPNTQWADNARTVEREPLGSSDGSADQTFAFAHGPIIDCEVWVDEAGSLSATERADLRESAPERVEAVTDDHGDCTEFWVRWRAVDGFVGSDDGGRIYRCDRPAGTITFGDGETGTIPPRGEDTVRATYTTGGGAAGNVEAGAITGLKTPISLVVSVGNPLPADGGAGIEPTPGVESRVANRIKTRGRAVMPDDFEAVAEEAVRKLAAVDCRRHLGPDGDRRPGWITLLIVPDTGRDRPTPSLALTQRVEQAVREAAPATLTTGEQSQIVVRGPRYAAVSVDATVHANGLTSISTSKSDIESALAAYLHPLSGGSADAGWTFGDLPSKRSLRSVVTAVEGIDRVTELSATVRVADEEHQLTRDPSPELPAAGLVCDGDHEITVRVGDRR